MVKIHWLEARHPGVGYYDRIQPELRKLGHNVTEARRLPPSLSADVVLVGFSWFSEERPTWARIPEFSRAACCASSAPACLCGKVPLVVIINKEYSQMPRKLAWVREHCISVALSVHHDVDRFENATSVTFRRIWFGVDPERFAPPAAPLDAAPPEYEYDVGFTGTVRRDQTANWRDRVFRSGWPALRKGGLRLFSGEKGSVHHGVAFRELNQSSYVRAMRASKVWLSTTGPAQLVGTRFFEVFATGTTMCVCNRLEGEHAAAYESLGIVDGRHALMFSSIPEFVALVTNYTQKPEYEERRRAILRRAQSLALRKFTWAHVAARVASALRESLGASAVARASETSCPTSTGSSAHAVA